LFFPGWAKRLSRLGGARILWECYAAHPAGALRQAQELEPSAILGSGDEKELPHWACWLMCWADTLYLVAAPTTTHPANAGSSVPRTQFSSLNPRPRQLRRQKDSSYLSGNHSPSLRPYTKPKKHASNGSVARGEPGRKGNSPGRCWFFFLFLYTETSSAQYSSLFHNRRRDIALARNRWEYGPPRFLPSAN